MMATTLAFVHMMNVAFINTLKQTSISLNEARTIGGTSFRLQLLLAEALFHENLHGEASILADNKYCRGVFTTFAQQVDLVRHMIQKKPQLGLMDHLRTAAAYVEKDPTFRLAHARFVAAVDASSDR
jgi:prephenate dehydrogenase